MRAEDSATADQSIAIAEPGLLSGTLSDRRGTALAATGVVAFSLTFPATAWALEGLGAWSATALRVALAGVLAAATLWFAGARRPARRHWPALATVGGGVVLGFPLLTTLALQTSSTSHAAVVVGLLPITTATYNSWRHGIRHSTRFWAAAVAGALLVGGFALWESGGGLTTGDLFLFGALLVCAAGYGEGGRLARELPGWQVIGWPLAVALPFAVCAALVALSLEPAEPTLRTVAGLAWLGCGSQWLGLVVWYRGMSVIGVGRASQLQLAQPLLTLVWSVVLVGEHLGPLAPVAAAGVLACIVVTQRSGSPARRSAASTSHNAPAARASRRRGPRGGGEPSHRSPAADGERPEGRPPERNVESNIDVH
ncbi:DMT family transporter [Streptomyces sp. P38-E01]|uniref:DMT family transporter n=1 Tax=Streptomyces tardus TaxID=2780544 RepID=A0A949JJD0_9ACTN|nr:DMT family transporter [Streptomyces tardus]MBU7599908.1 DMT family transporter [Streptomyces tardus]